MRAPAIEMTVAGADHIAAVDVRMRAVIERVGGCRLGMRRPRYAALVRAVVGQQVSTGAARSMYERLRQAAGGVVSAERVARLGDADLRGAGLSRQKAAYVRDLSERVVEGRLDLRRLGRLDDAAVLEALIEVKGVGVWTAQMFLMFVLHRPDVLPVGDLGIQKGFARVFELRRLPSAVWMERAARDWRPYRTVGSWYLWRSLDSDVPARRSARSSRSSRRGEN
jgi:DNA-3-methyladenine glycosylase II